MDAAKELDASFRLLERDLKQAFRNIASHGYAIATTGTKMPNRDLGEGWRTKDIVNAIVSRTFGVMHDSNAILTDGG